MKNLARLGATLAFAALALPSVTFASALTSSQVNSIISLLEAFGANSATIANVEAALTGIPTPTANNCVNLSQDLTLGDTDASTRGAVSQLQTFLQSQGYFTYQGAKGYYGFITAQAVGQYQMAHGLVSSSNDSAYGITGPQTRSAMSCGGQNGQASASINQSSLTTASTNPTITGTASNISSVYIQVSGQGTGGTYIESVTNGVWSAALDSVGETPLPPGVYQVTVSTVVVNPEGAGTQGPGTTLATGTLTITTAQSNSTFTASPTSGGAPLSVTFTTKGAQAESGSIDFGDGNSVQNVSLFGNGTNDSSGYCGGMPDFPCVVPHNYANSGTYTAILKDSSGNVLGTQTITVTGGQNQQSATIDQSSLTSTTGNPTITGTALNVTQVTLTFINAADGFAYGNANRTATVGADGRWSLTAQLGLPPGAYNVNVYPMYVDAAYPTSHTGGMITQGTLTVTGSQSQPSATIDQSSLTTTSATPTITGTASGGVTAVGVTVGQKGTTYIAMQANNVPVVNGRWSATLSQLPSLLQFTPGQSYTVTVDNEGGGKDQPNSVLAMGTLVYESSTEVGAVDQGAKTIANGASFTLTGTASGPSEVYVFMVPTSYDGATDWYGLNNQPKMALGVSSVLSGQWSISFSNASDPFSPGTYVVYLFDAATKAPIGGGTVSVTGESQAISPDGSILLSGSSGSLTTADGTWTFGSEMQPAGTEILLNGALAANGWGTKLIVANSGTLYTLNSYGMWWMWQNGGWVTTTNPVPAATPTATVDGSTLNSTSPNPTITGTATNLPYAYVRVVIGGSGSTGTATQSLLVPVTNGRWSASFNSTTLPGGGNLADGDYQVTVYATDAMGNATTPIVTGWWLTIAPTCPANATSQRGEIGQQFTCICPANYTPGNVFGSLYYTDNSDICTAGAQAGQIKLSWGGLLDYTIDPGQSSYAGSTQNGITSQSWGSWPDSFQITGPKACLAAGTVISMADGTHKNIENITIGDRVKAFSGANATTGVVANVMQREDPIVTINGTLNAAPDEVVYLANGMTKTAGDLKAGDQLLGEGDHAVTVTTITSSSALAKTYDLMLSNGTAFFADGYLVQSLDPLLK